MDPLGPANHEVMPSAKAAGLRMTRRGGMNPDTKSSFEPVGHSLE